mmetsp:Transcript_49811/g.91960  ORF Transcript_49811/g.91960 Transcript_49811/m.91960 type:complete len:116 (-) Transcript_49811:71-418(-)
MADPPKRASSTSSSGQHSHPRPRNLANRMMGTPAQRKEAADAWQEFRETVQLSDGYLFAMILGFSVLGNVYKIRRTWEIYIGIGSFILCFGIYVLLKAQENRRNPPLERCLGKLD